MDNGTDIHAVAGRLRDVADWDSRALPHKRLTNLLRLEFHNMKDVGGRI